jgi:hypothetical protein
LTRLNNNEDNFTERKPNGAKRDELRRTIVAFANSVSEGETAVLYIGVLHDGQIQGVNGIDSLQKTIRDICERDCYPPIKFACHSLTLKNQEVLAVEVPYSDKRPHFAGSAFVRIGSESKNATPEVYQELLTGHCALSGLLRWKKQYGVVTVIAQGKKLGESQPLYDGLYRARHQCKIVECLPQYVRLHEVGSDKMLSEPIQNIELSWDEENHRPMLIARQK